jgi:hypothetical protein
MNILVLSSERPGGYYNDPIHRGFFEASPHPVFFYGPNERRGPTYAPTLRLANVVQAVKADLVLVNMKKRIADWIDVQQLADLKVKKAMVDVDFCFERRKQEWYERCRFDVLFLRHKSDVLVSRHPRTRWLPFSVKPEWVSIPNAASDRRPFDVGFIGTTEPRSNYPGRNKALAILRQRIARSARRIEGESYMHWWQNCRVGLTCSCIWRYDNSKHLIIPGAGALLLSDGSAGLSELLPRSAYEIYKTDGSDLVEVLDKALADPKLFERRRTAAEHVMKHHTHSMHWRTLLREMESAPRG